ncbi:helix-turn-helix transcriptional regulator [bacterium]|nr:helix-turn-helix transcriptional regulator [bacterium]
MKCHYLVFSDLSVFKKIDNYIGEFYSCIHCSDFRVANHIIRTKDIICVIFQIKKNSQIAPYHIFKLKRYYSNIPFIAVIIDEHYEFIRYCGEIGIQYWVSIQDIDCILMKVIENIYFKRQLQLSLDNLDFNVNEFSPLARETIRFLEQNYLNLRSVKDIAKYLGIPIYRITKEIRKYYPFGPKKLLDLLKMQHAMHLMENDGYSIKEIAYLIGINDQRRFNEMFHRLFGKSPTSVREEIKIKGRKTMWRYFLKK